MKGPSRQEAEGTGRQFQDAPVPRARGDRGQAAWVRRDEPGKLRLLKGDMPLDAAYAPRLQAIFYSSEAWMLRSVLERERHQVLDLDPFTLLAFDASNVLDFAQQDVFFPSDPSQAGS